MGKKSIKSLLTVLIVLLGTAMIFTSCKKDEEDKEEKIARSFSLVGKTYKSDAKPGGGDYRGDYEIEYTYKFTSESQCEYTIKKIFQGSLSDVTTYYRSYQVIYPQIFIKDFYGNWISGTFSSEDRFITVSSSGLIEYKHIINYVR